MAITDQTFKDISAEKFMETGPLYGPIIRDIIAENLDRLRGKPIDELVKLIDGEYTDEEIAIGIAWMNLLTEMRGVHYAAVYPNPLKEKA